MERVLKRLKISNVVPCKRNICPESSTRWFVAASNGDEHALRLYLEANPRMDPDTLNCNGTSALILACINGKSDAVKYLLNVADVNRPNKYGYTPIYVAATCQRPMVVGLLLQRPDIDFDHDKLEAAINKRLTMCDSPEQKRNFLIILVLINDHRCHQKIVLDKINMLFY